MGTAAVSASVIARAAAVAADGLHAVPALGVQIATRMLHEPSIDVHIVAGQHVGLACLTSDCQERNLATEAAEALVAAACRTGTA